MKRGILTRLTGLFLPLGRAIAHYINRPIRHYRIPSPIRDSLELASVLRPGDVLLVEGNLRISAIIKYLTNSTWSHAALYVGDIFGAGPDDPPVFIEADIEHGVVAKPLSHYRGLHTRICRPVGLTDQDLQSIIVNAAAQIGHTYDLRNVFDLARYLFPVTAFFVPMRWRRRMIALGSGEPSKVICSTLIAQAFQSVHYPILPGVEHKIGSPDCDDCDKEILHIRHHSLFTPRDFDISPFFSIIKPSIEHGFNYRELEWGAQEYDSGDSVA